MKLTVTLALVALAGLVYTPQEEQRAILDAAAAGPAQRIWSAMQQQQVWLRRRFPLPANVTTARLVFTCDDECTVFVNGVEVAASNAWMELTVVDLDRLGRDNVIAVHARNTGGPAALACWLCWNDGDGAHALVTDTDWRISTEDSAGWSLSAFDDKDWAPATANFTTTFGSNVYNGKPSRIVLRNRFATAADPIERALGDLRAARDREAALRALDAVERAVVAARSQLWTEPATASRRAR